MCTENCSMEASEALFSPNDTYTVESNYLFYTTTEAVTMSSESVNSTYDSTPFNRSMCPFIAQEYEVVLQQMSFYLEGIIQPCFAILGLVGNLISAIILSKDDMRNSFNLLLIALICFDSWFLFGSILESFRRNLRLHTDLHQMLFPQFLYPAQSVAMSASIFMTVGIALERYIAVHHPIDYSQSMNTPEACRRRVAKYVVPVFILALLFNVPKFLEAKLHWETTFVPILAYNETYNGSRVGPEMLEQLNQEYHKHLVMVKDTEAHLKTLNGTQFPEWANITMARYADFVESLPEGIVEAGEVVHSKALIQTTPLRRHPHYAIWYNNIARLVALGIIPATMLFYFNYKIYKDIKLRHNRRMQSGSQQTTIRHQARRRQEDNLAIVFMGYVGLFLVCHFLRVVLNIHEMLVIKVAMQCIDIRERGFPFWALAMTSFSHFFLVFNSSTNMIIYCSLSTTFRNHFVCMIRCLPEWVFPIASLETSPSDGCQQTEVTTAFNDNNAVTRNDRNLSQMHSSSLGAGPNNNIPPGSRDNSNGNANIKPTGRKQMKCAGQKDESLHSSILTTTTADIEASPGASSTNSIKNGANNDDNEAVQANSSEEDQLKKRTTDTAVVIVGSQTRGVTDL